MANTIDQVTKYPNYLYPENIADDSNSSRALTFIVYDQKGIVTTVAESLKLAVSLGIDVLTKTKSPDESLEDLGKNMTSNNTTTGSEQLCTITLPFPSTFTDSQSHDWNNQRSLIGEVGNNLANTNIANTSMTEIAGGIGGYALSAQDATLGEKSVNALIGMATGSAIRKSNLSMDSILANIANSTGQRKPIIDPGYFQNYSGSTPRSFNLKYDLVPKNVGEARQILLIITKFKQYSSPSYVPNTPMLQSPYNFKMVNNNSHLNTLTAVDLMVLTNVTVDYGSDGGMELFGDGMPKHITLSLQFTETKIRTSEDFSTQPTK